MNAARLGRGLQSLGISLLSLGLSSATALADIAIKPETLSLSTTRHQTLTKTIQLSTDEPVTDLIAVSTDLEKADGSQRLLANRVEIEQNNKPFQKTTLKKNDLIEVTITIPSKSWPASGEFSGSLIFKHADGQQSLPLIIRVKDRALFPWGVLIIGVVLGSRLSWYRANGLQRDQVLVQVAELRTKMRNDPDFQDKAQQFVAKVEANLVDVETALATKQWKAAEDGVNQAQSTWDNWRKHRRSWISQLGYSQTLIDKISTINYLPGTAYAEALQAKLEDFKLQIANGEPPDTNQKKLDTLRQTINCFKEGSVLVEGFRWQADRLQEPAKSQMLNRQSLRLEQLKTLDLDKLDPVFENWKTQITNDLKEMAEHLKQQQQGSGMTVTDQMRAASTSPDPVGPVPPLRAATTLETVRPAQDRLKVFRLLGQGIAVISLTWLGMVELYEGDPTFGNAPMANYFSLLAWGFGAEVTRDSVVNAIQDLTQPLKKKENP